MSVMGLQKSLDGWWVGGVISIQFNFGFKKKKLCKAPNNTGSTKLKQMDRAHPTHPPSHPPVQTYFKPITDMDRNLNHND